MWETKVSNREKRQQRRKEKGSEDSGSSGGAEAPKTNMEAPVAAKRNKGNLGNKLQMNLAAFVRVPKFSLTSMCQDKVV